MSTLWLLLWATESGVFLKIPSSLMAPPGSFWKEVLETGLSEKMATYLAAKWQLPEMSSLKNHSDPYTDSIYLVLFLLC